MARQRQTPPPEQAQQQAPLPPGQVADRLGLGVAAGATVAAGAPLVAGVVSQAAITAATAKIVASTAVFLRTRRKDDAVFLRTMIARDYPQRTAREIDGLVAEENRRQVVFEQRMRARLRRDLHVALRIQDPVERQAAVNRILDREQRYILMRQRAMAERAAAGAEHMDVRAASPEGAYWALDPTVKSGHTILCALMGDKAWPWEVLSVISPLLHNHCKCHLKTLAEAKERGFLPQYFKMDVAAAVKRARTIIARHGTIEEAAYPGEVEAFLEMWLEEEARKRNPEYEAETARIKLSKETPEAKARHTFRAAKWTHPNGHPRCRLCGQEERIGGICNGKPTKAEAEAWAEAERKNGWDWQVGKDGKLTLALGEAEWDDRQHPRGREGQWIRKPVERALRKLIADSSKPAGFATIPGDEQEHRPAHPAAGGEAPGADRLPGGQVAWPDLADLLQIVQAAIPGSTVRDDHLLDAALGAAHHRSLYEPGDMFDAAANLIHAVQRQQALSDGNKRLGTLAGLLMLEDNGFDTGRLDDEELGGLVDGLGRGERTPAQLGAFLRERLGTSPRWPHPIPEGPPKFKLVGPGVYDTEDGRLTMYRIHGARPTAWNVEWTIDYANNVTSWDLPFHDTHDIHATVVDGAASKKDALAILAQEWPRVLAKIKQFELPS